MLNFISHRLNFLRVALFVCISAIAASATSSHVALAHNGVVHECPPAPATPQAAWRIFLPILTNDSSLTSGAGLPGSASIANSNASQTDDCDTKSHEQNDYDLAEAARKRNEPAFVADTRLQVQAAQAAKNVDGEWSAPKTWPFVFASVATLPDERIIVWGGNNTTSFNGGTSTYAGIWNPTTDQITSVNNDQHSMFCATPTMLEDGRVFVNGGDGTRERTSVFDYRTNTWTRLQDMSTGRWYNGAAALPDGRVFTALGDPGNNYPEVWSPNTGWSLLNGANLQAPIINRTAYQNTWLPYFHVAPDGRIFHSGPTTVANWIDPNGNGSIVAAGINNTWYPKYGAAVMYDEGKILVTGGMQGPNTQAATNQAQIFTINGGIASNTVITGMNLARKYHNGVVLPNGEVMMIGGNTSGTEFSDIGTQLPSEIWNPTTRVWRTVASISVPRNYHSVAVLMPNGRVFSGGGGLCACSADHPDHQIYTPPYLFNADGTLATRPSILSAPDGAGVGQSINVQASPGVQRFTMIRMTATTHDMSSDLRFLNVPFTGSGPYKLNLHSNVNVLIPGYWMLFALNAQGVPSLAKIIRVAASSAPVVTNPGAQSSYIGDAVNLQVQATDINNDPLTYSASGLPTGLSINSIGRINGTMISLGAYSVTVKVSDGGMTKSVSFAWNVLPLSGNLAQGKPVTASSIEIAAFTPNLAVDGTGTTRWSSLYTDPQWLQVDLGATRNVTRVVLNWEVAYGRAYSIQTSNDATNWTTIYSTTTGDGAIDDLTGLNGVGRYVRMLGTARATGWGYSLWELEVYGGVATLTLNPVNSLPRPVNANITYTASSSGGVNARYKWLWGDGSPETAYASSPNAAHAFGAAGLYTVRLTAIDDTNIERSLTFVQAVHLPQTTNRPTSSSNIAYETRSGANNRVWVVNQDNDTVSVFDAVTNAKVTEIAVGSKPRSIAIAPNGNVWVVNKGAASISIIAPGTLAVAQTVALPVASQPFGIAFSPAGNTAFVALEATGKLIKLDAISGAQTGSADVGANVRGVAISVDGNTVWVSRFITPKLPGEDTATVNTNGVGGEVISVNAANMTINKTVVLQHSDIPDSENQGRGIPNYLGAVALSPDGQSAWVPSKKDNVRRGTLRDGSGLTFQNTVRAIASRIDLTVSGGSEDLNSRVDHDNSSLGSAALFDKSGSYLFVALETSREVAVIDAYARKELFRFVVGRAPQGLALSADGLRLFVNNFMDRSIGAYDLTSLINSSVRNVPMLATLNAVGIEKLSAQVLTGKQLFYDAKDTRLARDSYMSCASCHNDGGQDGRVWDFTGFGEGLRNTSALNGRGGMAHGFLHWTGNFNEIQDFEGQIRTFAGGTGLMTDAQFNTGTRNTPLGDAKAGISTDLDAMAAYLTSLNTFAPSPYRNADGTLTTNAVAGKAVFTSTNCGQCHGGTAFSNSGANTLFNIGTLKPTSGQRLGGTLLGIDPPTLRDVWATGPYLHDGSATTLSAAISAHTNVTQAVALNATQIQQVVAYLQQIGNGEGSTQVTTIPQGTPVMNISQGKPATQSSTGWGGVPGNAVDGNTDGNYFANSTTDTKGEANAWWQVDLGGSSTIGNIVLFNRTDCCADRLSNFYVFVSSTDLTGRTYASLVADSAVWKYQVTGQAPISLTIPANTVGRYVRVQLAGTNVLSLAEVQVFGAGATVTQPTLKSIFRTPATGDPAGVPYDVATDAPILLVYGQSNSVAYSNAMTDAADIAACTNMPNVRGLSRAQNLMVGATVVKWSNYSCFGYNLGDDWNGGYAYHLAGLFARKWQSAINAGTQLPNLYVIHIGWSGQGFQPEDGGNNLWWPGRNPADVASLHPLALNVLTRSIQNLQAAGKRPRIIGLHWNQWETETSSGTITSAAVAKAKFGAFLNTLRASTGDASYPIYMYRPRVSILDASSTGYIADGITALASDPTPNVFQLIDPADATTLTGTPLYVASAAPNFGIYNDGLHYTRAVNEWFANKQWDLVFNGHQYGTPVSAPPNTSPINLADGKPATQSSTGWDGVPGRAVDGNTDGNYFANSTTDTKGEANAWWQVDLGANTAISNIVLWNRTDCCADRLTNFYVFVSATDLTGRTYANILADSSVRRYQVTGQAPISLTISANTVGRYVRVQLAGTNVLSLAEVQVLSTTP